MTDCHLSETQIQAWLDGEADHSAHVRDCADCQQRLALLQKVRARLTAPPSPLGRDFARRTAERVLQQSSLVQDVVQRNREDGKASWWRRVSDNPLVHVAARERTRRLFKVPGLVALLALYLVPGWWATQFGNSDTTWAYFGAVQLGLTVLVPLFLLSIEWTTLSSLVRGRCLEEMLQTGLAPALVSDTLALNGLRALAPAVGIVSLALLGLKADLVAAWLPVSLAVFIGAGYLGQAHLLSVRWPRLYSLLGSAAVLGALSSNWWLRLPAGLTLAALALGARRASVQALADQQSGRPQVARATAPGRLQRGLSRRLPDQALLQRELRRRSLWSPGWLVGCLACLAASAYLLGWTSAMGIWPLMVSFGGSVLVGHNLLSREKQAGAYEVLLHSGLRQQDWWSSAAWLSALQGAPVLLVLVGAAVHHFWSQGLFAAASLGLATLLALLVSLWAGAIIGTQAGLLDTVRQASLRCVREILWVLGLSMMLIAAVAPLLGRNSVLEFLVSGLGTDPDDLVRAGALLPATLALYLRAVWLRRLELRARPFNPTLPALAAGLPLAAWLIFWLQGELEWANSYAFLTAGLGGVWVWWMGSSSRRPWQLAVSYALCLGVGLPALVWQAASQSGLWKLLNGLGAFEPVQILVVAGAWTVLVLALRRRLDWSDDRPSGNFVRRSAGVALLGTLALGGLASQLLVPLPPAPPLPAMSPQAGGRRLAFGALRTEPVKGFLRSYYRYGQNWSDEGSSWLVPATTFWDEPMARWMDANQALFETILQTVRHQPEAGTPVEITGLYQLCECEMAQALRGRDSERVVVNLERMGWLSRHPRVNAQRLGWSLRVNLLLALRGLSLSAAQLDRLEVVLSNLPDDAERVQQIRTRNAVALYAQLVDPQPDTYTSSGLAPSWLGRAYLKREANRFLHLYAGAQRPNLTSLHLSDRLYRWLWQDSERGEDRVSVLNWCARSLIHLERVRLQTGAYPRQAPPELACAGGRCHYQSDGETVKLTWWWLLPDRSPLKVSTTDTGFVLR